MGVCFSQRLQTPGQIIVIVVFGVSLYRYLRQGGDASCPVQSGVTKCGKKKQYRGEK